MWRRGLAGAALLAMLVAERAPAYTVKGSIECPDIVREDSDELFRALNKWWLLGYFTARNYSTDAAVGKGVLDDNLYLIALDFCRKNPRRDWDDAAIYVYSLMD